MKNSEKKLKNFRKSAGSGRSPPKGGPGVPNVRLNAQKC